MRIVAMEWMSLDAVVQSPMYPDEDASGGFRHGGWHGPYLDEADNLEEVEKGIHIRFWHRPLSRYLNSARAAGMVLDHMEEPAPPPGFLDLAEEYTDSAAIPRLMFLRFSRS